MAPLENFYHFDYKKITIYKILYSILHKFWQKMYFFAWDFFSSIFRQDALILPEL